MLAFAAVNSLIAITSYVFAAENTYSFNTIGEPHSGYYISFEIGTPPQLANLLIDTGSSNFAISAENDANYVFRYKRSKSFVTLNKTVAIRYTEGSWTGFLAKDVVHLCPEPSCTILVQFACITSSEYVFEENTKWNGILGLAFASIAEPHNIVEPFFDTLVSHEMSNIFCTSFCGPFLHENKLVSSDGMLHLGYVDNSSYSGTIVYTPLKKEWYYEVIVAGVEVGEDVLKMTCSQINEHRFIIDTGTSLLAFPSKIHQWVIDQIKTQAEHVAHDFPESFWTEQSVNCIANDEGLVEKFPSVVISFYHSAVSTFSLVISPELYLLKVLQAKENRICLALAIVPVNGSKPAVIGAAVMKGFYVVFDRENKQVGFGNATCPNGVGSTSSTTYFVTEPITHEDILDCEVEDPAHAKRYSNLTLVFLGFAVSCSLPLLYMLWLCVHAELANGERENPF